jgi:PAS domain S-box-containing protein
VTSNQSVPGSTGKVRRPEPGADVLVNVFDHSLDGVIVGVPDGQILYANRAACEIFGGSEDDLARVGRQGISDEDDPDWQAMLEERRQTGQTRGVAQMHRLDGTPFLAEVASAIFQTGAGEQRTCVIVRDVTERVHEKRRLVAYDEIAEALLGDVDITEVLAMVARHARIIFDASATIISALDGAGGLAVVAADGPGTKLIGRGYQVGDLTERVMASSGGLAVEDFTAVALTQDGRSLGVGPAMVLPIVAAEQAFGILLVGCLPGSPPYGPDDLAEATQFALRAGVVLALGQARAERERQQQRVAEQLQHALDSRIVIEQAKGFIAATRSVDIDEAFSRLRKYSRSHNTDIHEIAAQVLKRTLLP